MDQKAPTRAHANPHHSPSHQMGTPGSAQRTHRHGRGRCVQLFCRFLPRETKDTKDYQGHTNHQRLHTRRHRRYRRHRRHRRRYTPHTGAASPQPCNAGGSARTRHHTHQRTRQGEPKAARRGRQQSTWLQHHRPLLRRSRPANPTLHTPHFPTRLRCRHDLRDQCWVHTMALATRRQPPMQQRRKARTRRRQEPPPATHPTPASLRPGPSAENMHTEPDNSLSADTFSPGTLATIILKLTEKCP